jgi:hypothetical protein
MVSGTVIIVPSASTGRTAVKEHLVTCKFDECMEPTKVGGWCAGHYMQNYRGQGLRPLHTTPGKKRWKRVSYRAAHKRLDRDRGRAAEHTCVDCDQAAEHWSFVPNAREILYEVVNGSKCEYSLNQGDYEPRCRECHWVFDNSK